MSTTDTDIITTNNDDNDNPAVDTTVIDAYIAVWNETDEAERNELIEAALGADLWYRDPMLEADGRAAFAATIASVQETMPGHVMTRTSDVDAHHDLVRFNWALARPGEAPAFAGVDVAKYDADGKLHRIIGFAGEALTTTARA